MSTEPTSRAALGNEEGDLRFVETIQVLSGQALALPYHQARMERTIRHFFPSWASEDMPSLESLLDPTPEMALFKARVVYGAQGVEAVEYVPYAMRTIRSLQVVEDDTIDYAYKCCDRSSLAALVARKGTCDEIIIVKNGLLTDTSYTNLALFDGRQWLTPRVPLLAGTKRAALLDQGLLQPADLSVNDLRSAQKVRLFNAMIDFGTCEVETSHICF